MSSEWIRVCNKKKHTKKETQILLNEIRGNRCKNKDIPGIIKSKIKRWARRYSKEKRIYHCPVCDAWHLTSKDSVDQRKEKEVRDGYGSDL